MLFSPPSPCQAAGLTRMFTSAGPGQACCGAREQDGAQRHRQRGPLRGPHTPRQLRHMGTAHCSKVKHQLVKHLTAASAASPHGGPVSPPQPVLPSVPLPHHSRCHHCSLQAAPHLVSTAVLLNTQPPLGPREDPGTALPRRSLAPGSCLQEGDAGTFLCSPTPSCCSVPLL